VTVAPEVFVTLADLVGGFLHGEVKAVDASHSLFVGIRSTVAEIRMPLSVHGPLFAKAADQPKARGELYFQIATILLQAHDYELASTCYRKLADLEPQSSEALFGLGMCEVCRGEIESGLEFLKAAKALDPQNAEIQKWIDLAGLAGRAAERAAKTVTTTLRGGPVIKPMPKATSLPSAAPAAPERTVRARS
jgi:tetratricopeptide (TPR) repeat protein